MLAIANKYGLLVSYECSDLIEELKLDIKEFGGDTVIAVWCKMIDDVEVITNYDFISEKNPLAPSELLDGEYIKSLTMTTTLDILEKQNSVL